MDTTAGQMLHVMDSQSALHNLFRIDSLLKGRRTTDDVGAVSHRSSDAVSPWNARSPHSQSIVRALLEGTPAKTATPTSMAGLANKSSSSVESEAKGKKPQRLSLKATPSTSNQRTSQSPGGQSTNTNCQKKSAVQEPNSSELLDIIVPKRKPSKPSSPQLLTLPKMSRSKPSASEPSSPTSKHQSKVLQGTATRPQTSPAIPADQASTNAPHSSITLQQNTVLNQTESIASSKQAAEDQAWKVVPSSSLPYDVFYHSTAAPPATNPLPRTMSRPSTTPKSMHSGAHIGSVASYYDTPPYHPQTVSYPSSPRSHPTAVSIPGAPASRPSQRLLNMLPGPYASPQSVYHSFKNIQLLAAPGRPTTAASLSAPHSPSPGTRHVTAGAAASASGINLAVQAIQSDPYAPAIRNRAHNTSLPLVSAITKVAVRAESHKALIRQNADARSFISHNQSSAMGPGLAWDSNNSGTRVKVDETTLSDWELLLERNRMRMMRDIDEVTTLMKLPPASASGAAHLHLDEAIDPGSQVGSHTSHATLSRSTTPSTIEVGLPVSSSACSTFGQQPTGAANFYVEQPPHVSSSPAAGTAASSAGSMLPDVGLTSNDNVIPPAFLPYDLSPIPKVPARPGNHSGLQHSGSLSEWHNTSSALRVDSSITTHHGQVVEALTTPQSGQESSVGMDQQVSPQTLLGVKARHEPVMQNATESSFTATIIDAASATAAGYPPPWSAAINRTESSIAASTPPAPLKVSSKDTPRRSSSLPHRSPSPQAAAPPAPEPEKLPAFLIRSASTPAGPAAGGGGGAGTSALPAPVHPVRPMSRVSCHNILPDTDINDDWLPATGQAQAMHDSCDGNGLLSPNSMFAGGPHHSDSQSAAVFTAGQSMLHTVSAEQASGVPIFTRISLTTIVEDVDAATSEASRGLCSDDAYVCCPDSVNSSQESSRQVQHVKSLRGSGEGRLIPAAETHAPALQHSRSMSSPLRQRSPSRLHRSCSASYTQPPATISALHNEAGSNSSGSQDTACKLPSISQADQLGKIHTGSSMGTITSQVRSNDQSTLCLSSSSACDDVDREEWQAPLHTAQLPTGHAASSAPRCGPMTSNSQSSEQALPDASIQLLPSSTHLSTSDRPVDASAVSGGLDIMCTAGAAEVNCNEQDNNHASERAEMEPEHSISADGQTSPTSTSFGQPPKSPQNPVKTSGIGYTLVTSTLAALARQDTLADAESEALKLDLLVQQQQSEANAAKVQDGSRASKALQKLGGQLNDEPMSESLPMVAKVTNKPSRINMVSANSKDKEERAAAASSRQASPEKQTSVTNLGGDGLLSPRMRHTAISPRRPSAPGMAAASPSARHVDHKTATGHVAQMQDIWTG